MPKSQKSSASSATRKKHARKATVVSGEQLLPLPKWEHGKGEGKGKNKEPRQKVYIPPSKPAPIQVDPLDRLGLAKDLPADFVIILRRLGKKDSVTKRKALEDFQNEWVAKVLANEDDVEFTEANLLIALPVWLHYLPSLFIHASRRIRLAATTLHFTLLQISSILEQMSYFLREIASSDLAETILGCWCIAVHDIDRQVSSQARRAWDLAVAGPGDSINARRSASAFVLESDSLDLLIEFSKKLLFEPQKVYMDLNPTQRSQVPETTQSSRKGIRNLDAADEDTPSRVKSEEEESDEDRKTRLRVSALGMLKWFLDSIKDSLPSGLDELLHSTLLWTTLYHGVTAPFCAGEESLGLNQPVVRRAAWAILHILLKKWKDDIQQLLPILSTAILRSAWVETESLVRDSMWEPLLTFLTQYPQAWEIELTMPLPSLRNGHNGINIRVEKELDESSDDDDSEVNQDMYQDVHNEERESKAYRDFLQFLELGCSGSPLQGYPTVVIILSTIPPKILGARKDSWNSLFGSFWAALDGRALSSLDRTKASAAFLSSVLECLVFLIKRWKTAKYSSDIEKAFVRSTIEEQIFRLWTELSAQRLGVDGLVIGKLLTRTLQGLHSVDPELYNVAWDCFSLSIKNSFASKDSQHYDLVVHVLKACNEHWREGETKGVLLRLIGDSTIMAIEKCNVILSKSEHDKVSLDELMTLKHLMANFDEIIFADSNLAPLLDGLIAENIIALLTKAPSTLVVYIKHRRDFHLNSSLWHRILSAIASDATIGEQGLRALLLAVEQNQLPDDLRPEDDELDVLVSSLAYESLHSHDKEKLSIVRRVLQHPARFLSRRSVDSLLHSIIYAFSEQVRSLLHDFTTLESIEGLYIPLDLFNSVLTVRPEVTYNEDIRVFLPDIFIFGYLFPHSNVSPETPETAFALARLLWSTCISRLPVNDKELVLITLRNTLRDIMIDVDSRVTPFAVLEVLESGILGPNLDIMDDFLPSRDELDDLLQSVPTNPIDKTLAIVEFLTPPPSSWTKEHISNPSFDSTGLSEYARVVNTLLHVLANDRQKARENLWALRHFIILANCINHTLQMSGIEGCVVSGSASRTLLADIVTRVQKINALLLIPPSEESWHANTMKANFKLQDSLGQFVTAVLEASRKTDSFRDSLVLYTILQHILSGATKDDSDSWILLARKIEKQAPQTAIAIIQAVTKYAPEPARLDRYRNELASEALGISDNDINFHGLFLIRRLAATAPDPDSDSVFLPQTRAVNFMKACQQWLMSDQDISEEIESQLTVLFTHLAPILQNVSGAHWDLMFDVIENNLENCSFGEIKSLVMLYRTLKLVSKVRDLVTTNKALRAVWLERESTILTLIRDTVTKSEVILKKSTPHTICWETALSAIQNLPPVLIDHNTLPNMCHLLLDDSFAAQQMVFSVVRPAAHKFTEHVVVEAAVDTSDETRIDLPIELLEVLRKALERDELQQNDNLFAYLLGWMIIFDLFEGSSLRVKVAYLRQLRELVLIESSFVPSILHCLNLYADDGKLLRLDPWALEEYYVEFYEVESALSNKLLAAHLFYRALLNVRSLITDWWRQCKDRQLSMAVANTTARYFSPMLVAAEFAHLKDPEVVSELKDENWDLKVSTATNEVSMMFNVDEQQLEIRIKIPLDYPLHNAEIKDVNRVGVEEQRLRGWILAVQQVLTGQSGRIVDGLSIFKKNVTTYFKDRVECAICYSVVSPMDMSLPKKRCKTCRNQFHAGCLYKWFNTSHSSSCPLCRSDFL